MNIRLHPHALARLKERGATEEEVVATVQEGERFPVKCDRVGFRRNFAYNSAWRDRFFATKQGEAIAVAEDGWLVLTVIVRAFEDGFR